ncbi:hypothetical protein [Pantoea sp. Ap-870]
MSDRWSCELNFLSKVPISPMLVNGDLFSWVVDLDVHSISNGRWLLGVGGKYDIYDVTILPKDRINVSNSNFSFICEVSEIEISGKVVVTMDYSVLFNS